MSTNPKVDRLYSRKAVHHLLYEHSRITNEVRNMANARISKALKQRVVNSLEKTKEIIEQTIEEVKEE